jgi:hypothetical protein
MNRIRSLIALTVLAVCLAAAVLSAQFGARDHVPAVEPAGNVPYDGRFVFVRLRYNSGFGGGFGRRGREAPWAHDYPTADVHMMKIVNELTMMRPRVDGSNVVSLEDPELCNYPVAYMSEPGFWTMDEDEARGFRNYLLKGGFVIFDDFRGFGHWDNLEQQMRRVLPEARFIQIDATHPIFHSFFEIDSLDLLTSYGGEVPTYFGIFENNDPKKRMMAIANYNNDLGEYWEFSDTGLDPVDLSNEAYKFGVNYFIYGLTH